MRSSAKFFLILSVFALACVGLLHHLHLEWITVDQSSVLFGDYSRGFEALIENELSKNSAASKPTVKIRQITETENELSIQYDIRYIENFRDGEIVTRNGKGWALMRKDSSGAEWKLYRLRDASQTLRFNKGTRVGS